MNSLDVGRQRYRYCRRIATIATSLICSVLPCNSAFASDDSAAIVTVPFTSLRAIENLEFTLGESAATYVNLQLWRTLQRTKDVEGDLTHSHGTIWWDSKLRISGHAPAEKAARDLLAQMTLWGVAFAYGDGVIVQPYLSVPRYNDFRADDNERWSLSPFEIPIEVDMPRRRYDFSPIELAKSSVDKLKGPFAFEICKENGEPPCEDGESFGGFEALEHHSANCSLVRSLDKDNMREGWICGAIPSERNTEVVEFVAGILRVMRADWKGAVQSFKVVIDNPDAETRLKVDARLFLAMSLSKSGQASDSIAQEAFDLSPNSQVTFKYLVMSKLATWNKKIEHGQATQALAEEVERLLAENRVLVASNDPWLIALDSILVKARSQL